MILLQLWFATVLRDGIALSASGGFATFREIASNAVKQMMAKAGSSQNPDEAAANVIQGFEEVQAHPDVLPGLQAIHHAGIQVTNAASKASLTCYTPVL
jgi:2-haloacid dehalogenase